MTYDGSSTYNIIWAKQGGISLVNLSYSTNGGTNYNNIIGNNISATSSPYPWTIPDAIGSSLKVRIAVEGDPSVNSTSLNNFSIKGSLWVTSPNGNETWLVGSNQSIQWNTTGTYPGYANIYYSNDSGGNWTQIGTALTNDKVWYWDPVPDDIGTNALIKVATNTTNASIDVNDTSNATFKIRGAVTVLEPNGNEHWFVNDTTRQIRWTATGTVTPVKIEYSLNGGSGWIPITNNYTGVSGSTNAYNWTPIPDNRSETCIVRVSDNRTAFTSTVTDISNANFTILPQISIYQPATYANLTASANGTQAIRWNYTGHTIDKVNIDYYDGANWTSIQTNVNNTNNAATYYWPNVPTLKTSQGLVRITDVDMPNVTITSSSFFIRGYLNLTSPLGNTSWPVGSSQLISWSSAAISQINVSYSLNNGSNGTWTYLGSVTSSPYTWNISNSSQVSNLVRVRVADQDDQLNVSSTSPATFAILPVFDIQHPESGDNVTAEESYNISWTTKGTGADNIYLQYTPTGQTGQNWTNITNGSITNLNTYNWNPVPSTISNYTQVRIFYTDNPNATDTGADYFNLRGKILVTSPNGDESWQIGEVHNITWTKEGNIAQFSVSYSSDNGGNWTGLGTSSASPYSWNITSDTVTTTQAKIKVADSTNPEIVFDTSNTTFEVRGRLDITQPDGGQLLTYDGSSIYNVTWTKEGGISRVNLTYSTNNGVTYPYAIATNISSTASPQSWTIPDAIGSTLRVHVEDVNNPTAVYSNSTSNFAIKGSLWVTSPNGNETWLVGSNQSIQWNTTGTYPGYANIYYSNDSGGNWTQIGTALTNDKVWYWDPVTDDIGANALIKVATNTTNASIDVNDTSNATFKIRGAVTVLEPNGNEHWFVNETTHQIRWSATGTVTPVKIEYSLNGGSGWIPITNNYTGVSGSTNAYNWTPIPDNRSETCIVRVSDNRTAFTSTVTDTSNANFTILPQINIYLPAVNDNLTASASGTQAIRWNYTGHTIDKVNIDYSTNGGANWTSIQTNVNNTNNASTYFWPNVPTLKTPQGLIRVTDIDMANVTNQSGTFNIRGFLNLTAPLGNNNWLVGSQQLIQWSSAALTSIDVSYSSNNGSNWTALGTVTTSPYTWNISNSSQVSNSVKVRITDHDDLNTTSTSPATFAILPVFDIQHPESGDNVTAEESYNISWTTKGTGADNIYLQYTPTGQTGQNWTNITNGSITNLNTYNWNPVPSTISNYTQVRIFYTDNPNATDTGADYFNLRGKILVTSPNGDESWQIGEVHNITWTKEGNIAQFSVSYSSDNGGNWTGLGTSSASPYSWNITSDTVTTTQAKIKVADSTNPEIVFDTSNTTFEVRGRLDITQPDGGQLLTYDGSSIYNVTWTKEGGISRVNLTYSTNNGVTYPYAIATNISSTASPQSWTIPDAIGSTLRVHVEDVNNPTAVYSNSTSNFAIKGSLWVTSPNGNETWLVGSNQSIQWNTTGTYPGYANIYYSNDSGGNWTQIGTALTNDKVWYWDPVTDDIGANALIKVATNTTNASIDVNDTSNATFKIRGAVTVLEPNGNEHWFVNETTHQIRWSATGTVTPVKIEYSLNGGSGWIPITNNYTGVSGSTNAYNWTPIPDNRSETCIVRVSDNRTAFTSTVTDTSNANFTILPQINIYLPAVNDNLTASASGTQAIRWNYTGHTIDKVNIDYSTNGGANWTSIQTNVNNTNNASTYFWPNVPTLKTPQGLIRVTDIDMANVTNQSGTFNIRGFLNLTAPLGNTSWPVGSQQLIQWQSAVITLVNISYSLNNGTNGTWTDLGSSYFTIHLEHL